MSDAYKCDPRWVKARAELMEVDAPKPKGGRDNIMAPLLQATRASVRMCQIEMIYNPEPESEWAFLLDPDAT